MFSLFLGFYSNTMRKMSKNISYTQLYIGFYDARGIARPIYPCHDAVIDRVGTGKNC